MFKPTLLIDFDCTITQSRGFDSPPNKDAVNAIIRLSEKYKIVIFSCRANDYIFGAREYVMLEEYLNTYGIPYDEIATGKPIFYRLIDDRSINPSKTNWDDILKELM